MYHPKYLDMSYNDLSRGTEILDATGRFPLGLLKPQRITYPKLLLFSRKQNLKHFANVLEINSDLLFHEAELSANIRQSQQCLSERN